MEQAAGIYIGIGPIFIHASRDGAGDELFVLAVCPRSLFHFHIVDCYVKTIFHQYFE